MGIKVEVNPATEEPTHFLSATSMRWCQNLVDKDFKTVQDASKGK